MIVDVQGKEAKVGQLVAFAGGMKGASEFYVGYIDKVNPKTVTIGYEVDHKIWSFKDQAYIPVGKRQEEVKRNSGMFVILEGKQL